jgi:drug/metabolite transporter (DMT)-like permease
MEIKYILVAIFISFLWGVSPLILKQLVTKFDKMTILAIDGILYFIFTLLLGFYYYDTIMKDIPKITLYDAILLALIAILPGVVANVLYMTVIENHDSYIITALVCISPFFTLALAYLFTKENVTVWGALGTALIVSGILMISYNDKAKKLK